MRNNSDPKWEVVSEGDEVTQRKKALSKAHRMRGVYFIVSGLFLIVFALGLAGLINEFSEYFSHRSGSSHYSELLPSGAVLCGVIAICKGLYKVIAGE